MTEGNLTSTQATPINIDRLMADLSRLAEIGASDGGDVSRPAMSDADALAREFLLSRLQAAGLSTRIDAAGNIFGRWEIEGDGPCILTGSHIDTVDQGGRFDGTIGVFGALECVRAMQEANVRPLHAVEVVSFNDEEERFFPFLGSRSLMGECSAEDLAELRDKHGIPLADALNSIGCPPASIGQAKRSPQSIAAFVELHIEQGPILEREGLPIGVVDGIKGNYRWEIAVSGRTDHAGAPPEGRADAFAALLDVVQGLRAFHDRHRGSDATFTVGSVTLSPGIETAQAGKARCSADFRSSDLTFLRAADQEVQKLVEAGQGSEITITLREIIREDPVGFDREIQQIVREAAKARGYGWRGIASGAGHDAQVLARYVPTAMIFVPSAGGRSHCPEEFTETEDIARGVSVLHDTLRSLATRGPMLTNQT